MNIQLIRHATLWIKYTGVTFRKVTIQRTIGQHGTGEIGQKMGHVSGPDMTIVNAGGARFAGGGVITMNEDNVIELIRYAPYTQVVAVHMDSINHCHVTRAALRTKLSGKQLLDRVYIPKDGDWL